MGLTCIYSLFLFGFVRFIGVCKLDFLDGGVYGYSRSYSKA